MRLLADENVARSVVLTLRQAGHDIISVHDQKWQRISDSILLTRAQRDQRVILTHDQDFVGYGNVGVILIRFRRQRPRQIAIRLTELLNSKDYQRFLSQGALLIVTEMSVTVHAFR